MNPHTGRQPGGGEAGPLDGRAACARRRSGWTIGRMSDADAGPQAEEDRDDGRVHPLDRFNAWGTRAILRWLIPTLLVLFSGS